MKKSLTAQLATEIEKLLTPEIIAEIRNLPRNGPKGGSNAKTIKGWVKSPNGQISRACSLAGVPTMNWFDSYKHVTPTTAIPACIDDAAYKLYKEIFT